MGFELRDRGCGERWLSLDFWNWRSIVEIVRRLRVVPDDTVSNLQTPYCGYGLDREQASLVAAAIESEVLPGLAADMFIRIDGSITKEPPIGDLGSETGWTWYRTNREVLLEFIDFCRNGSGFDVL